MAADPRGEQLTASSKAALRWAWASAVLRTGSAPSGAEPVTSVDLLTGILLAHPRDSEPRQLLAHFGVPLGAVLGRPGARPVEAGELLATRRGLPDDELPPLDSDASLVLDHATGAMPNPNPDGLVSLRVLFGALLETTNPACLAIRTQLTCRGVDPDALVRSYRDFLTDRRTYDAFLRERHPSTPPRVELPAYQADQPITREPPRDGVEQADLVGIKAEVDAFAYLVASRALSPPLAIGLFGDWGSGKSFFLRSLQRRIDALVTDRAARSRPRDELPFYPSIVQIEFNAWQYVEGDLWASLLEHIFRNLRTSADDENLLAQHQRAMIERITQTSEERDKARRERAELEQQQRVAAAEVAQREAERELALDALERERREHPLAGWKPSPELREQVRKAAERAGVTPAVDEVATEAAELQAALTDARDTLRSAGPVLAPLQSGGWRYTVGLVTLLLLTPAIGLILERLDLSAVSSAAGSIAWLLATAAAYVRTGSRYVRAALGELTKAQQALDAARRAQREEIDATVRAAQERLDQVEQQLVIAVKQEHTLEARAAELDVELARTTPSRVLDEFITERLGSDDYRRHLGVPALVRRDLERLSRLVQEQHTAPSRDGDPAEGEYPIDRVVLYIDDLDRCPTPLVVKVLQAVHLLLAFPLFVVVVAVDARWLAGSLKEHYSQLGVGDASPDDYLEKIFQVPFWVRPLPAEVRQRMLRGLMTPSLASASGGESTAGTGETAAEPVSEADRRDFVQLVESLSATEHAAQPWLEAARLAVTTDELACIEAVAPLLGTTPRSVKRFANVYLLLKSMSRGRLEPSLEPRDDHGRVILLLAIASGLPRLAELLFAAVERTRGTSLTLAQALQGVPPAQCERLTAWLADRPEHRATELSDLGPWINLIRRFSFQPPPADLIGP